MRGQSNSLLQWACLFGLGVEDYNCFISVSQEQNNEHKTLVIFHRRAENCCVCALSKITQRIC